MQVGNIIDPPNEIIELGFSHVQSIKILGMEIYQNISNLDQNFSNILDRVKNSISYWKRYNLTLNGRINVIKSLLVSLINHLGCILMPSRQTLNNLQKAIDDFAIGKLNVARSRICLPTDCGGLGLFNLEEFLTAQQCTWVLRANKSLRDNWRYDLYRLSSGNCLSVSEKIINKNTHPFCMV
jgi:hypothetical protein